MSASSTPTAMPERIGRYEVLLPIASGGMGTVYLARAKGTGGFEREVAIKLMHLHLLHSESVTSDLLDEAKLTVRIRHPNVVSILDFGEDALGMFLVMDYVEGDTLSGIRRRALKTGGMPIRIGLRILVDALSGLHAAHELKDETGKPIGVVHRDFSPQNILIGTDGIGRLADFGIAKVTTNTNHTTTGIVKGKISYMSPEQARGERIDRRCDVWAAGVVAWELVAQRTLHSSDKGVGTLFKIATETPPRASTIMKDVPKALDDVIARALTPALDERYESAAALKAALVGAHDVAPVEEVAAYVNELVAPILKERRSRVAEVRELRERMGKLAIVDAATPSPTLAPSPDQQPTSIERAASSDRDVMPTTDVTAVSTASAQAAMRGSRALPIGLAIAGVVVLGAVVVGVASSSSSPTPSARASATAVTPNVQRSVEPTPSATATAIVTMEPVAIAPTTVKKPVMGKPKTTATTVATPTTTAPPPVTTTNAAPLAPIPYGGR